jgi:hypothetical protein
MIVVGGRDVVRISLLLSAAGARDRPSLEGLLRARAGKG